MVWFSAYMLEIVAETPRKIKGRIKLLDTDVENYE